ncbi:MAG: DNA-methyltransferase [Promethearchaeota archaeon]
MPRFEQEVVSSKAKRAAATYPARLLEKMLEEQSLETPATKHHLIVGDSRQMLEVPDNSVQLVVTSPPYPMIELWDDLFQQQGCRSFSEMHNFLAEVWRECYRVLVDGGIACINIGDALRKYDGGLRLFPNHVRVTEHCETIGFISLPFLLWKKPTTRPNAFLGSGFLPPNAYVTQDCEFILLFRKGSPRSFPPKDFMRYASHYTKAERDAWFTQIWRVPGARQENGDLDRRVAAYPEEIARRLIRMFSIYGDTVLDPFLGTGTTMKVANEFHRNSIGYEIDDRLLPTIKERLSIPIAPRENTDQAVTLKITRRDKLL